MIRIIPDTSVTLNDLVWLHQYGFPVTTTSHPGNASLYKLSLWSCGIPETLWDITCVIKDRNNQPAHLLCDGTATLLTDTESQEQYQALVKDGAQQITAYTRLPSMGFLGRAHVKPMMQCFPAVINTQSALMNTEWERLHQIFAYLAETIPDEIFTRYIFPDGTAVKLHPNKDNTIFTASKKGSVVCLRRMDLAESFRYVLSELEMLLHTDYTGLLVGGACYQGSAIAQLSVVLVQYWKTGSLVRYDISGPDMIHYATSAAYQEKLNKLMRHIAKQFPELVPKSMLIRMPVGTFARVGYLKDHVSKEILENRIEILSQGIQNESKKMLRDKLKENHHLWPLCVEQGSDAYFSQHDLVSQGGKIVVPEYFRTMPFGKIESELGRLKNILRV